MHCKDALYSVCNSQPGERSDAVTLARMNVLLSPSAAKAWLAFFGDPATSTRRL